MEGIREHACSQGLMKTFRGCQRQEGHGAPPPIPNSEWRSRGPPSTKLAHLPATRNRFFLGFPVVNI